ncbi:MAG: NAD(P)-binding protein [Desulfosalsimonas sp.]
MKTTGLSPEMIRQKEISVIGGNVAGLSAAFHLARRGFRVTVYESSDWNKPCGGAVSCEFAGYLRHELGIVPQGADQVPREVRLAFRHERFVDLKGFFLVTRRMDLQQKLIMRLGKEPGIDIVFRRASITDRSLFTPQTIVATGFSRFTRQALPEQWRNMSWAAALRFDGEIEMDSHPGRHLMFFDSRINGYGWLFIGRRGHVNIGAGGLTGQRQMLQWYDEFLEYLSKRHGYHIRPEKPEPRGWKIPVCLRMRDLQPVFCKDGVEFIGTGDALGLAHPFTGAGIEPAWQSGRVLAECADPETGVIDTRRYAEVLVRNLRLTCRKPIDLVLAAAANSRVLPGRDALGFIGAKLATPYLLRKMRKHPWFALVHDGKAKTGCAAPR